MNGQPQIKVTNDSLGSLQCYVSLRKKVMGLEKVRSYDLYVPLVQTQEVKIPYKDAQIKLAEALTPLGDQYITDMKKAFENRWIDVYENPNKLLGHTPGERMTPIFIKNARSYERSSQECLTK